MGVDRGLLERIRTRGQAVLTELSAELLASPRFSKVLSGALRGRERLERAAAAALTQMNVPTRGELKRAHARIDALERELAGLRRRAPAKGTGHQGAAGAGRSGRARGGRRPARTKPAR